MDKICYVTTSRGIVMDELSTPKQAFAKLASLKQANPDIQYKVIRGTKCRLILSMPTSLSIPANANIIIAGDKAYSYLKDNAFDGYGGVENVVSMLCPYTGVKGLVDQEWYNNWKEV